MSSPPDSNARIFALAEAIADGRAIDWAGIDVNPDDPAAQQVLDELRVLAALADLHRSPNPTMVLGSGDEPTMPVGDPAPREGWGSFRLIEELGRGTFGTVYRARDPRLDREVALKLIAAKAGSPEGASSVVDEGRLLAKLRHPNIVTVFGADIVDGVVGVWMELLRGRTLKEELASRGPLGAREAALVGIDLAHALAAVHRAGLVHRDIKAQNVMREEGGRIVLMDFGAGRDLQSRADRPLSVAGTPLYMAPELLAGQPATPASDLYGLGVLLYHLVTGEFPVDAQTMGELKAAHAAGRRRHLRDVRPDLPSAFIQAVESATAALPSARVPSAAALEHDLERVLQGLGAPATPADERRAQGKGKYWWLMLVAPLLLIATLALWNGWGAGPSVPTDAVIASIAVLPFSNLTGQADQEYLADGVTDILIGNLAQLRSIRVISRTSAMTYKGTRKPLATIAQELNVDGIIEGSVARSGDRLRVVVQLVRANEQHVWGQTYERPAADLFRVQGEISGMVADAIKLSLTPAERKSLTATPAMQVQAQDAFLRGLQRLNDQRPGSVRAALASLEEAVRLDPTSARAYATLSQCYLLAGTRGIMTPEESYAKALAAATRALQLDDTVAQAHTQLAEVKFYFEWDWQTARRGYERALALNPNDSHALARYSVYLSALDEHDAALKHATLAQALDPISPTVRNAPAMVLFYARRYDDAIAAFLHLKDTEPLSAVEHFGLGRAYAARGRFDDAIQEIAEATKPEGPLAVWTAELARIHAETGSRQEALRLLGELTARVNAVTPASLAFIYAALGDVDRAFQELNRAADQRAPILLWANVDPRLDTLRGDARYRALTKRIGLPQ